MSATNIQWITIAVLGFGAVFAFFVLVFVFEATVHALRYRDQYAGGGGGGFRMPGFGGRQGGGFSPSEPSQTPRTVRQRDPQVNRALAREAARIAADERIRSGEVRLRPVPDAHDDPPLTAAIPDEAEAGAEPVELAVDEAAPTAPQPTEWEGDTVPPMGEHQPLPEQPLPDPETIGDSEDGQAVAASHDATGPDADQADDRDATESAPARPLVAEPLVLTARHEVTLDKDVSKPKAGRVTMRATKGPLLAAVSTFRRNSGQPPRDEQDSAPAANELTSAKARSPRAERTGRSTTGLPEHRLSELRQAVAGAASSRQAKEEAADQRASKPQQAAAEPALENQAESLQPQAVSADQTARPDISAPATPEPASVAPEPVAVEPPAVESPAVERQAVESPAEEPLASEPLASDSLAAEAARPSKVAQPSQPESEVMADTTRQLKSLRDAEQFGGGPQTGEASCPLYLRYRSASGIIFDRIVQAVTLEEADGEWIMRAFCHRSKAMRRIRVSNVVAAFDLRNRDVSVGGKVPEFLRDRVPLRDSSGQSKPSEGGASPAAAE